MSTGGGYTVQRGDDWLARNGRARDFMNVAAKPDEAPPAPLSFVNMSNWDAEPVPEQDWAVPNRIPRRQCVLFSGEGAGGKSTVQLHLSAAHVLGRDWLGTIPALGPAIFIDAEDDEDVMHRRLAVITKHYCVTFADLIKGGLHLISLSGQDAVLAAVSRGGKIEPTPRYRQILEAAGDIKPVMIGLASSANFYAGSEIDRAQVQQFITLMTRLAIIADGSVVLISHPSLTGIANDSGLSGNTQWHNAVRARFYIKGVKPDDGDQADSDLRELVFKKNNYGPISQSIVLCYRDGMFLPVPGVASLEKAAAEQKTDELFLTLLRRFTDQGRNVTDKRGTSYAPAMFAAEAEAKKDKTTAKDLGQAMSRLFAANKITVRSYGPPSRCRTRIVEGSGMEETATVLPFSSPSTNPSTNLPPASTPVCVPPPLYPAPVVEGARGLVEAAPSPTGFPPTYRPRTQDDYEVIGAEPDGTVCVQCGKSDGTVYLIRDPFKGVRSEPLHETCAKARFQSAPR